MNCKNYATDLLVVMYLSFVTPQYVEDYEDLICCSDPLQSFKSTSQVRRTVEGQDATDKQAVGLPALHPVRGPPPDSGIFLIDFVVSGALH